MPRSTPAHRLITALFALGLMGTLAAAQPPAQRPPADPLAEARARQAVADQKATIEVMGVIATAERQAKTNPVKAVQTLKAAQVIVDSPVLSTDARKSLLDLLTRKIAAVEGRPIADAAAPRLDPKGAAIKYDKQAAYESAVAELKSVNDGIRKIARYHDAGMTREADRELALTGEELPEQSIGHHAPAEGLLREQRAGCRGVQRHHGQAREHRDSQRR